MEIGKMTDDQKLMKAIELELEAIRIYFEMARNTKNPELIKLFHSVAYEEKVHVGEFLAALLKIDRKFREGMIEGLREQNQYTQAEEIEEEIPSEEVQESEEDLMGED